MIYNDLPDDPFPGVRLYCPICSAEYSAAASDYSMCDPGAEVECGNCGTALELRIKQVTFEPVGTESRPTLQFRWGLKGVGPDGRRQE